MLLSLVIFVSIFLYTQSAGFEINLKPNCNDCKWFIANHNKLYEPGVCGLFSNKIDCTNAEIIIKKYAIQCRLNSNLCGMDGSSFTPNVVITKNINPEKTKKIKDLYTELQEVESNFNGEICEKDEIKKLETELEILKKRIKELEKEADKQ